MRKATRFPGMPSGVKLNDMSELPEEYSSRLMSEYSDYSYFDLTKDLRPVTYE